MAGFFFCPHSEAHESRAPHVRMRGYLDEMPATGLLGCGRRRAGAGGGEDAGKRLQVRRWRKAGAGDRRLSQQETVQINLDKRTLY